MPLFMDHHRSVEGLTTEEVADAHRKDVETQDEYGVKYHRYWFNEETGEVFCLAEAPNKEAAESVHCEAHGLERIAAILDHTDHGRRKTCASHQSDFSTPLCEVGQLLCNLLLPRNVPKSAFRAYEFDLSRRGISS